ncbi:hypothetical protein PCO86_05510 [Pectobacteriaceae bacterium CE70]|nr:hypothetical protein PCO87_05355 [Pectobacteriaceae bacterium C52]WJV67887.1 hypothetical protein PCO86_05510 [Pectobacteriaceae bacterium CE70]WJY11830.1 hypothetical protein PCO80_05330 [Pectobacteriaceae bacterium C80]
MQNLYLNYFITPFLTDSPAKVGEITELRVENGRFSSIIILTCKNSYFFKKDIILKSKQNFLKDEKSDWDIELGLLEQNSYSADLKEAVSATFKVASVVLSFLPDKKRRSSSLTDGLCENTSKDGFRDGHSGYGYYFGDIKNDD